MRKKIFHRPRVREFKPAKSSYLIITETYLIPLLIIFIAGLSFILVFKSDFFKLKSITCSRDGFACQNNFILSELAKYRRTNLFLFPKDQLKSRLLAGDKTVSRVELDFTLPDKLEVKLVSTTPKVALQFDSGQKKFLLIDDHFRPIRFSRTSQHLPVLSLAQPYTFQLGQTISNPDLAKALAAITKLNQLLNQPFSAKLDQQDLYLDLTQKKLKVRLTVSKSLTSQLQLLRVVLSNVKMLEEEQVGFVDVRFGQPVLKSY